MRNFATAVMIAIGAGMLVLPVARAQDQDSQQAIPKGQVKQHQEAAPAPQDQDSATRRDQSAQTPAVITPPATGDRSVITPPETGDVKTPVIPPPGTPGGNKDVQPN
jgi:hypothetical protein